MVQNNKDKLYEEKYTDWVYGSNETSPNIHGKYESTFKEHKIK